MEIIIDVLNKLPAYIPLLCTAMALPAFAVSVVVQVVKNLWVIKKVPTDILVLVVSLLLCIALYGAALQITATPHAWYLDVGAIIFAFFVAFVSTNSWRELHSLWQRFAVPTEQK